MNKISLTTVLAIMAALALAFGADSALAFKRASTMTGPGGKSATNTATVNKTGSGYERTGVTTGPGGKSATTKSNVEKTGSGYERDASVTGPGGKSASSSSTGSWDSSTKTWNKSKTYTTPSGQTGTVEKSSTYSK